MAGDFDETMEDFEDRIRLDERTRTLTKVHAELYASFQDAQECEAGVAAMLRRLA